ncbi:MAG: hypothetical protein ACMUIU_11110 [bacterium]
MRNQFKLNAILLVIGGILLLFLFSIGKEIILNDIKKHKDTIMEKDRPGETGNIPRREKGPEDTGTKYPDSRQTPNHQPETVNEKSREDKVTLFVRLDSSGPAKDSSIPKLTLNDIAIYDRSSKGYVLRKSDLFKRNRIGEDLLSLLSILNKKNMPPDYFQWHEYDKAYKEIDLFYNDTYIWPYFSNTGAKTNFFLYLFTRYAADNEKWRSYEKDRSDCSQFSQRIYMLLSPDEVYIPDGDYFRFLFSSMNNRLERKKLCNKIPDVFYTTLKPCILNKDSSGQSIYNKGHAMISFAPDNNPENWILGEPQNGTFKRFGEDIGSILDAEYTQYPLICNLGKILSIKTSYSHEANTVIAMTYFIPRTIFENTGYGYFDTRSDYGDKPLKMEDHTYQLFQFLSPYITKVLDKQPINKMDFSQSLETILQNNEIFAGPNGKGAVNQMVDIIMYGLIDLDRTDLRRVYEEMKGLEKLSGRQHGFSAHTNDFIKQLSYSFLLKLEPLI